MKDGLQRWIIAVVVEGPWCGSDFRSEFTWKDSKTEREIETTTGKYIGRMMTRQLTRIYSNIIFHVCGPIQPKFQSQSVCVCDHLEHSYATFLYCATLSKD